MASDVFKAIESFNVNEVFNAYFSKLYGQRWSFLSQSLQEKEKQVLRVNQFADQGLINSLTKNFDPCVFLKNCFWRPENFNLGPEDVDSAGLQLFYIMDPASVIVALSLEVNSKDLVLDLCAAPGGKSLVLAEQMQELSNRSSQSDKADEFNKIEGTLISNEYSESRRERLTRVFQQYIPKEKRLFINVKGLDGNQYGLRQAQVFDRVLADVPCSGERHLFENPSELKLWSEKRTKNLAVRQFSLLSSAWLACKVGGRIVYSTCSISNTENDEVVRKLIKKRKPTVLRPSFIKEISKNFIKETSKDFIEETEFGYQILPDKCGFGPMYFSVLEKK